MTKKETLSVCNIAEAATIPTFEEVYAMEYVQASIRTLVMENSRKYPMLASYEDDIKQELLIHLANSLKIFDPRRASIQTYCRMVLHTGLKKARNHYLSKPWSILSKADQIDTFISTENSFPNKEKSCNQWLTSDIPDYSSGKKEAFATALAELSEKDKKIAEAIMSGVSLRNMLKHKICNNYYLYEHAIPAIRRALEKNYF